MYNLLSMIRFLAANDYREADKYRDYNEYWDSSFIMGSWDSFYFMKVLGQDRIWQSRFLSSIKKRMEVHDESNMHPSAVSDKILQKIKNICKSELNNLWASQFILCAH